MTGFMSLCLVFLVRCAVSELTRFPSNTVTYSPQPVTLECRTNSSAETVHWTRSPSLDSIVRGSPEKSIFTGLLRPDVHSAAKYFINTTLSGQYDLTLIDPTPQSSGVYVCRGQDGFGDPHMALLLVLSNTHSSGPFCAYNLLTSRQQQISVHVYPAVESPRFTFRCEFQHIGHFQMSMSWRHPNDSVLNVCSANAVNNKKLECELTVDRQQANIEDIMCVVRIENILVPTVESATDASLVDLSKLIQNIDSTLPYIDLSCHPLPPRNEFGTSVVTVTTNLQLLQPSETSFVTPAIAAVQDMAPLATAVTAAAAAAAADADAGEDNDGKVHQTVTPVRRITDLFSTNWFQHEVVLAFAILVAVAACLALCYCCERIQRRETRHTVTAAAAAAADNTTTIPLQTCDTVT